MTSFFIAPIDIDNLRLYNIYAILGIWENMRKLEDKNTGLVWILPEVESVIAPETPLFPEDKAMLDEFTKELNQYQSAAITRFVTGNCANLGDFLVWVDMDNLPSDMIDFEIEAINNNKKGIKFSCVYADNEKKL